MRRELLSLFPTVYVFIKHHHSSSSFLWPSVRKELAHPRSLLPMAFIDVGRPWSSLLTATDASLSGFGVCERRVDSNVLASVGRHAEKWRYDAEDIVKPRDVLLGCTDAALVSGELNATAEASVVLDMHDHTNVPADLIMGGRTGTR